MQEKFDDIEARLEELGLGGSEPIDLNDPELQKLYLEELASQRGRRTYSEIKQLERRMLKIIGSYRVMNLRQLFYRMVSSGYVNKTESEYQMLGKRLVEMRRAGRVPWEKIADHTRWVTNAQRWKNREEAVAYMSEHYRKALRADADEQVEIWCEKDALAGVMSDVTLKWDIPLYVSRGFSSETYVYNAAQHIIYDGRPCFIYEFGDHDPSGVLNHETMKRKLLGFVAEAEKDIPMEITRVAVTPEQIEELGLPTRPTKREGNKHLRDFEGDSVELDAIPPDMLQDMVEKVITQHVDLHKYNAVLAAEESDRTWFRTWGQMLARKSVDTEDDKYSWEIEEEIEKFIAENEASQPDEESPSDGETDA